MTVLVPSSSGAFYDAALFGYSTEVGAQGFSPEQHAKSSRVQRLVRLESYFRNRQHDHKTYDWAGHALASFEPGHQPLLSTAQLDYFPHPHERRPAAPYRLLRRVTREFSSLLFGEGRFPEIRVVGDPDTQDFAAALSEAQSLPLRMKHARDVGGSSGTVGLSWRFWQGKPRCRVHPGSTIHCQEWDDFEERIPRVVTEILQVEREVVDPKEGLVVRRFWRRRDWTPVADVVFVDRPCDAGATEEWVVDESEGATCVHNEGFAHFVWVENAADYDGATCDGEADYEGTVEAGDMLDIVFSATAYGGAKNLEPTLLLALEPDMLSKIRRVQKGADRALPVGTTGAGTKYLELSGASITAGIALSDRLREAILETCQVVIPDPDKVAAAGTSSVALKLLYAPMLAPAASLRAIYGRAIVQLLEQQIRSIRARQPLVGEDGEAVYPFAPGSGAATESRLSVEAEDGADPEGGVPSPEEEDLFVDLPPRVVEEQVKDPETGLPTGEKKVTVVPRKLGVGGSIELHWPDWFPLTADDRSKETSTLSTAAGGKPVISQKSAVEKAAQLHGLDPAEEWKNVTAQIAAEADATRGMYPPAGMPVDGPEPPQGEAPEVGGDTGVTDAAEAAQATGQDVGVLPETVLNGAQVTAALAIVTSVSDGTIPRDAALGQLEVLFNLQPGQALKILGSVGTNLKPKPAPAAPAPAPGAP